MVAGNVVENARSKLGRMSAKIPSQGTSQLYIGVGKHKALGIYIYSQLPFYGHDSPPTPPREQHVQKWSSVMPVTIDIFLRLFGISVICILL